MRLLPRSMAGRMIAVLVLTLTVAQVVSLLILIAERDRAVEDIRRDRMAMRIADAARFLEEAPSRLHPRYLDSVSAHWRRFYLGPRPAVPAAANGPVHPLQRRLAELLGGAPTAYRAGPIPPERRADHGGHARGRPGPPRKPVFAVSVPGPGGQWLNVVLLHHDHSWKWLGPPLLSLSLSALALAVVVVLLVRRTTRPLARLAGAAERFGRGDTPEAVPEQGPEDVRRTIRAFNAMQERLDRFVRDRTRMLAAISHDLRTPLTSLRLRAEMLPEGEGRERMVATLEEMQRMTEAALSFAHQEGQGEAIHPVDLGALLDSLCEDLRDLRMDVTCGALERVVSPVRATALKRAVRNLVENAVAYGGRARVTLEADAAGPRILVDDDGPGIPEADAERVFDPYVRLEDSRNPETGGIGLGLAIARDVVRSHGGDITLANRPGGGLRVTVHLPPAPEAG
ncbi:ATP-binding protein [Thiohalorhabdus methylotrophus]|uniref:histidine kinase n=1 Tax=Thiohalorhabdus methylotrophus TaxID=3242694 RepID=A0ABV4TYL7_9GAMM